MTVFGEDGTDVDDLVENEDEDYNSLMEQI